MSDALFERVYVPAAMRYLSFLACLLLLLACTAGAANGNQDVIERLAKQVHVKPGAIAATPIPNLYRVQLGPRVDYITADGHYFIRGEIIDLKSGNNLTLADRARARLASLQKLSQTDMIVFAPPHPTSQITVLTDIDCEFCRLLERERPVLNSMGVEVRYLFFPRDGVGTVSWNKAVSVWCAKDRKAAFLAAMSGKPVDSPKCDAAPVAAGYEFGQMLGIDGTPAIITERGRMIDGYLPLPALVSVLGINPHKASAAQAAD